MATAIVSVANAAELTAKELALVDMGAAIVRGEQGALAETFKAGFAEGLTVDEAKEVVGQVLIVTADRMAQNLDLFDFALTDAEMEQIAALNAHDAGTVNFSDVNFVKYLIETYG